MGVNADVSNRAAPSILLGTLLLLLLCIASGRPQVFSDTKSYYALGHEAASVFNTTRSDQASARLLNGRPLTPAAAAAETRLAYTVSASRSPYWSILFYLAVEIGSAWLMVVLQSLAAAAILWIAAGVLGVRHAYLAIVAGLALLSSLPVQVMFLMPDLFAGLAILAALLLIVGRDRLTRLEAAALWVVIVASALFHTSHVLLIALLGIGTLLVSIVRRHRALRLPGAAMLAAAAVGAAGAIAFPLSVQMIRHQRIYAPPFLSARLIADGPGRALLRRDCVSGAEWGWCGYMDRPLNDVNTILWNDDPRTASFQAADYDRRVRIIGEQPRFVLATIRAYPDAVLAIIFGNIAGLLFQYGSSEALGDPTARYRDPDFAVFSRIVPDTEACATGRKSCASRLNLSVLDAVTGSALLLSCVVIAATLTTAAGRARWNAAALFVLFGLLANAVVCGSLSGNAERYQSRVTWLVPLLALAMIADWFARRAIRDRTASAHAHADPPVRT